MILIFSDKPAEQVLGRLRQFQLYANLSKCQFNTTQVEFLGFIVSTEGIKMDEERVKTIRDWPTPKTYREVQVFLGFANFYRRFIFEFSRIAQP